MLVTSKITQINTHTSSTNDGVSSLYPGTFSKRWICIKHKWCQFSSTGIDEAHECTIGKDCEMSLSRSLPQNMNQIAETMQFAAQLVHVYVNQLGAARKQ